MALDIGNAVKGTLGFGNPDPLARRQGETFSQYLVRLGAGSLLETAEDRRRQEHFEADFAGLKRDNASRFKRAERQIDAGERAIQELRLDAGLVDPSYQSGGVLNSDHVMNNVGVLQLANGGLPV